MRFSAGLIFSLSASSALAASDGVCLADVSTDSYFPGGGSNSWLKELVFTAIYDEVTSVTAPTTQNGLDVSIGDMLADAGSDLVEPTGTQNALLSAMGTNAGELDTDCFDCVLEFYNAVRELVAYNKLPAVCQHSGNFDTNIELCRYALSEAIVAFDNCTGADENSIGSEDAQLGANGCTASQIMQLDGEFNIYSTLIDKIVFDADATDFDAAVEALPCHKVFEDWIDGFNVNVATLKGATKCGTRAGQLELQYDIDCYGITGFTTTANNDNDLAEYFADLPILLGGGFSITTNANTRCSADEATIISQLRPFGALIKCSFDYDYTAAAPAPSNWAECMNEYWPGMSGRLTGLDCADCFTTNGGLAEAIFDLRNSDLATCDENNFGSGCLNGTIANALVDGMYQCTGFSLSTVDSVCTTAEISTVPAVLKSIVPYIALAKSIMGDSSLTTSEDRLLAAIGRLSELPSFGSDNSATPCMTCFGALITQIVTQFDADSNLLTACDNEYAVACLRNTFFAGETGGDAGVLDQFEACSGFALATTSSYTCDDDQYAFITDNNIPHKIFALAMAEGTGATAASVISNINALVATVLAANPTVELPCANCVAELITGLFALDETTRAVCLAAADTPATCFGLDALSDIVKKYKDCSGHEFNAMELTNDDGAEEEDDTTDDSTDDTNSAATFGVGLTAAFGLFAAVAVL